MIKGIVITPDMQIRVEDFGEPLHETVGAVVGSHIEHSLPKGLPAPYCMIVNGKGRLKGLQENPIGCELYGTPEHGQPIVGTIVLMKDGIVKGESDIVGLTDEDIDELFKLVALIKARLNTADAEQGLFIKFTQQGDQIAVDIHANNGFCLNALRRLFEVCKNSLVKGTPLNAEQAEKVLQKMIRGSNTVIVEDGVVVKAVKMEDKPYVN